MEIGRRLPRSLDRWLKALPFDAYCWECPPVTSSTVSRAFECVFVSSPSLARTPPEREAFAGHFRPGCHVVTFGNLGGDAVLVAPCPTMPVTSAISASSCDVRGGETGRALASCRRGHAAHVGDDPTWLSTAGHGIAWLHVRLDSQPKYYRYRPYVSR